MEGQAVSGPYFDFNEGGAYLGISGRTLRRRLPSIPHFKTDFGIRFSRTDLDEWIAQFRKEPTRPAKIDLADIIGPRRRRAG